MQPDVTKVGGLSEQRRIAWLAQDFGVRYVGHGWNTALGIAADLQLAAALPNVDLVEYIAGSAYVDNIMAVPFKLDAEGMLAIPDAPGLGVALELPAIPVPAVFGWLAKVGGVAEREMLRTFNCGIGMIVAAQADKADEVLAALKAAGEAPVKLGEIVPVATGEEQVSYRGKLSL